ncbi:hypothetical protein GYMLUDRAFT_42038 [Collybiopsis luxurians FD-317 M1]|uniref:Uncharacterized protein n=1 Tax=Collybiopsis luxurians FD-317 M1 TaxID=944289 RepID=A0A0D0C3A2_9AGAR|nr:hypothetical protein GYMLUDRAFT_42038 [Collybiopsis luxurians FD-317 M1]
MPISPMTLIVSDLERVPSVAISKRATGSAMLSQLCLALESARERNAVAACQSSAIAIPTLSALIPMPVLSEPNQNKDDDNDDVDSDNDSDTDSTISSVSSSRFSDVSSAESMTSISSSSTSSTKSGPSTKISGVYVPPHRLTTTAREALHITASSDSILPHRLPAHPRRRDGPICATSAVDVDKSKISACRYLYQGGETNVVGGGVMLGTGKKPVNSASSSNAGSTRASGVMLGTGKKSVTSASSSNAGSARASGRRNITRRSDAVMLGPDLDSNWRRGRSVRVRV